MKHLSLFFLITSFIYSSSFGLTVISSDGDQKETVVTEEKKSASDTSGTREEPSQKQTITIIKKWDNKTGSWKPWVSNEPDKSGLKKRSFSAYTHILVWNCEETRWKPYETKDSESLLNKNSTDLKE